MRGFFRPFLVSLILSLGATSPVFAEDPPLGPVEADFEAVEQELENLEPFPEPAIEPAPKPQLEPPQQDDAKAQLQEEAGSESVQSEKEEWMSPYHSKSWPGSFVAVRLGFGAGNILVPQFAAGDGVRVRAPLSQIAPYAGIELGATKSRWGGSFSAEGTIIGPQAEFLSASPVHVFVSLNGYYAPKGSLFRWALGLRPFIHYGMESPDGQFLHLRGYGFHLAAHRLLKRTATTAIEAYVTLSMDRFTEAVSGSGDDGTTVPMGDLIGPRTLSAAFMIQAGIQFALLR